MNIVPKLIESPTWATIASFNSTEMVEFAMFSLLSIGLVAAVIYWTYRAFRGEKS